MYVLVLVLYKNVILNKSCSLFHQNTRNEGWNTLLDSDSDDHLGESLRGI